jgi:hypothetical protein
MENCGNREILHLERTFEELVSPMEKYSDLDEAQSWSTLYHWQAALSSISNRSY